MHKAREYWAAVLQAPETAPDGLPTRGAGQSPLAPTEALARMLAPVRGSGRMRAWRPRGAGADGDGGGCSAQTEDLLANLPRPVLAANSPGRGLRERGER